MGAPITPWQRFVLQNIFDSQPAHRAAYLEKLGYQMNPKDTNEFRPLGSSAPFMGRVDPGFNDSVEYVKKGHLLQALGEGMADVNDNALDLGKEALPGIIGMMVGGPPAAVAFTTAAQAPAVRALMSGTAEHFKNVIGDMLIDKAVPAETGPIAVKVAADAFLPALMQKGASASVSGIKNLLTQRKDAIVSMANQMSGGTITEDALKFAADKLGSFTKKAVIGANDALNGQFRKIFGQEIPTDGNAQELLAGLQKYERSSQIPKNSLFGAAMDNWNQLAGKEVDKLSKDPNAGIRVGDVLNSFNRQLKTYADGAEPTTDEIRAAIPKIERNKLEMINAIKKQLGVKDLSPDLMDEKVPFDLVYKFSKTMKDGAYTAKGVPIEGAQLIRQVAGGAPGAVESDGGGLGNLLTKAADEAGSNWSQIQSNRSNIKAAYNYAVDKVTPNKMMSAFIGQDSIPKQDVQKAFSLMDAALGTDMAPQLEKQGFQRAFEQMIQHPRNAGSSNVLSDLMVGALNGAKYTLPAGMIAEHTGLHGAASIAGTAGALYGAAKAVRPVKPEEIAAAYANRLSKVTGFDDFMSSMAAKTGGKALNTAWQQPATTAVNSLVQGEINGRSQGQPKVETGPASEDMQAIFGKPSSESSASAPVHTDEDYQAIFGNGKSQ